MNDIDTGIVGAGVIAIVVLVALMALMYLIPLRLWVAAWSSGAYVGLVTLVGMQKNHSVLTVTTQLGSSQSAGIVEGASAAG